MERTLLQKRASALGSTPKPHCDDGHGERRTDLKPRGHVEQLQKNGAAEHGQDGPKLRRARHHTPLPPPANVRTIEAVVEQPLLERGPAFTRRPSGQDQERDGRQHRDRDADDTDDECGKRSGTPKQVPRLSQHAWILSGKGHEHPAAIVIPQQRYVIRCEPDAKISAFCTAPREPTWRLVRLRNIRFPDELLVGMPRKNSLVGNINRRKRKGTSRPKSRSTVSKKSYRDMQRGWPARKKRKKAVRKTR